MALADCTIEIADTDKEITYDGNAHEVKPTVSFNGTSLTEGQDYTLSYVGDTTNVTKDGVTITITGKGNFEGTITKTYKIVPKQLTEADLDVEMPDNIVYDGTGKTPTPTVKFDGKDVTLNTDDYDCIYGNNVNAGENTATLTITPKHNYTGPAKVVNFTIAKKPLADCTIEIADTDKEITYDGNSHEVKPKVSFIVNTNENVLVEKQDYTLSYPTDTMNVPKDGVLKITISAAENSNYTGTATAEYTIVPKPLTKDNIVVKMPDNIVYDGTAKLVKPDSVKLKENEKIDLSYTCDDGKDYKDNVDAGEATLTIQLTGNYSGKVEIPFTIAQKPLGDSDIEVELPDEVVYNEQEQKIEPTVKFSKSTSVDTLVKDRDYELKYDGNATTVTKDGETGVTVTITGKGNFTGKIEKNYKIVPKPLTGQIEVQMPEGDIVYDSTAKTPEPTVKDGETVLKAGTDYVCSYTNNVNASTAEKKATLTITMQGNYSGTEVREFTIQSKPLDSEGIKVDAISDITYNGESHGKKDEADNVVEPVVWFGNTKLEKGTDYELGAYTGETTDVSGKKVIIQIKGIGNFASETTAEYMIVPRPLTKDDVTMPVTEITYDGKKHGHKGDPEVEAGNEVMPKVTFNGEVLKEGKDGVPGDYTLAYDGEMLNVDNAGVKITITGTGNFTGTVEEKYTIVPRSLKDTNFISVDEIEAITYDGESHGEEGVDKNAVKPVVKFKKAGATDTTDLTEKTDYTLSYAGDTTNVTEKGVTITITGTGNFKDAIEVGYNIVPLQIEMTLPAQVTSHDGEIVVGLNAVNLPKDKTLANVASNLVEVNANVDTSKAPKDLFTFAGAVIDAVNMTVGDAGACQATFTIPEVSYESEHGPWKSGLPAGSVVSYTITDARNIALVADYSTTIGKAVTELISAGTGTTYSGEGYYILDGEGEGISGGIQFTNGNAGADDVVIVSDGSGKEVVTTCDKGVNAGQLKQFATETADWCKLNPQNSHEFTVKMYDVENHEVSVLTLNIRIDTGADNNGRSDVGNRADAPLDVAIVDSLSTDKAIDATNYGGTKPKCSAAGTSNITVNFEGWQSTPDNLPHSGSTVTLTYFDLVGHQVTHTISVSKSPAKNSLSLYVKPMEDNTVGSGTITFYGTTTTYEKLLLKIAGRTITIDPIAGGGTYNSATGEWKCSVNLSELDFPVGAQQTVTISYEDLSGGDAPIQIAFKDKAEMPALSCGLVGNMNVVWGYVEEKTTQININIRHADGSEDRVHNDNIVIDQFGYFYADLGTELAVGDVVEIRVVDFVGNEVKVEIEVEEELAENAKAVALGANIVGEVDGSYTHSYATPVNLARLSESKEMTVPILAYDCIEVGTLTFYLDGMQLKADCNIEKDQFIPEGAKAYVSVYDAVPGVEELLKGSHGATELNLQDTLVDVNVAGYMDETNALNGVVWVYAACDVVMDENSLTHFGGRGVNFYPWVEESKMEATGRSEKERQKEFYTLYQSFQNEL